MGSAPSHPDDGDDYDYDPEDYAHDYGYDNHGDPTRRGTRSLRSAQSYRTTKKPSGTRSTILRVEKTQQDIKAKEERDYNQQNGFTPFTPRGTIGYDTKPKPGSYAPPHSTSLANKNKGGKKGRPNAASVSFHPGNVYISDDDELDLNDDDDDGLTGKDKIESYMRKSRVPETKVRPLAVKLWEVVHKEHADQLQKLQADDAAIKTTLQSTINQPLDLLLYGKANRTSLKGTGVRGSAWRS